MPFPEERRTYRDIRENGSGCGGNALGVRRDNASVAAATGRKCRRSSCRVQTSAAALLTRPETSGGKRCRRCANSEPVPVPAVIRRLRCRGRTSAFSSATRGMQASQGGGENGKRYQLHQPASIVLINHAGRYLSLQTKHSHSAPSRVADYNNGATLLRAGAVRIHFFHRICNLARPVETPLCKMCFYCYTSSSHSRSKNNYIFKMKDLERFLGRQSK